MELGTYDMVVEAEKYLKAIARSVSISGGLEDVMFDPEIPGKPVGKLRGGDCNGDNAITLEDFSLLASHYNKVTDVADINGDGEADLLDFIILASNYGSVGVDGRVLASPEASSTDSSGSNRHLRFLIHMDKDAHAIRLGDEFGVCVRVDNANNLKGYSIRLQYDHRALQIIESDGGLAEEGTFLKSNSGGKPTLLISKACEDGDPAGRITLSSYITGANADGVSGSGSLATLRFRLVRSSPGAISIHEPVAADDRGRINVLPREEFALQMLPQRTSLLMNYPNPLNPETWIPYELSEASDVRIEIHNLAGQLIRALNLGYREAGFYNRRDNSAHWDGRNEMGEEVASGIYFCTIRAGGFSGTRKMTVIR
jgi:hypothetical protein